MELTPNDIRNTTFESGFRGYEKEQVDAFIETVAAALEQARTDMARKAEEFDRLRKQNEELKEMEDTVKHAVLEAQKHADQIIAHAKKEAELMLSEAKQKRDAVIEERHRKVSEVQAKVEELQFTRNSFYNKLRGEIEAHLKLVNSISPAREEHHQMPVAEEPKHEQPDTNEYHSEEVQPDAAEEAEYNEQPSPDGDVDEAQPGVMEEKKQFGQPEAQKEQETTKDPLKSSQPQQPERPTLEIDDNEIDRLVEGFQEEVEKQTEEVANGQSQREDI